MSGARTGEAAEVPGGPERDPGLQPERTALAWRRTVISAVIADVLIWRAWIHALTSHDGADHSAQLMGLGICAAMACLTTIVLVICAVGRIRALHAGVAALDHDAEIAPQALMLRTASAAIVALAVTTVCALGLGFS